MGTRIAQMSRSGMVSSGINRPALCSAIITEADLVGYRMDNALQDRIKSEVKNLLLDVVEKLNEIFYSARKVGEGSTHYTRTLDELDISLAGTIEEARSKAGRKFKKALGAKGLDGYKAAQDAVEGAAVETGRVWLQNIVGDAVGWCAMHNADVNSKGAVALGSDAGLDVRRAFSLAARLGVVSNHNYLGREKYTKDAEMLVRAILFNTIVIGIANGKAFAYGMGGVGEAPKTIWPWCEARLPQSVPLRKVDRNPCCGYGRE